MIIQCPYPGCNYEAENDDAQIIVALLNIHAQTHATAPARPTAPQPKLDRPRVDMGIDEEVWNSFIRRWEAFRVGSCISIDTAPMQLFQCATESLGDLILKAYPDIQSQSLADVLKKMRELAVIPVAIGVRRAELMDIRQSPDEPFRTFAAKVQGKAETCAFTTTATCSCGSVVQVEYKKESVRDVLLAGIADMDIRREALSTADMQEKSINEVIAFVESREMARNAMPLQSLSALSSYKSVKIKTAPPPKPPNMANKKVVCPDCKKTFYQFKQRQNGSWNTKPFDKCLDCWRSTRKHNPANSVGALSTDDYAISTDDITIDRPVQQISGLEYVDPSKIMSKSELKRSGKASHPRVKINIALGSRISSVMAVADSGAMSNVWGMRAFLASGFSKDDLKPVVVDIKAANRVKLNILGHIDAQVFAKCYNDDDEYLDCNTKIYISDSISDFFLSYNTMLDLGILGRNFPAIGEFRHNQVIASHSISPTDNPVSDSVKEVCQCPKRGPVPARPDKLPFEPIKENNDKMREWLLDTFGSSTFNTCPHTPLPSMTGPPIKMHVDESAEPKAYHTSAPIALHWQDQVHQDLLRDEALGVIEKVPYGEPVTWCHRMVVTRKHDGSPRRTVDLSPLNKFCRRETFSAEAPFPLARRVPGKTWKTVVDAWNGYHSVPLREEDRHLTTFITPFGRWRYTRAPQGYVSSGDGYNRRFDEILSNFERKERCVDDVIFHDEDLETHWWRTIDLLITCGKAGIILVPKKFQFAQREAEFAGFDITEDKILPLPKYIAAIQDFPTPTSTTDIRSWFGLVNRVANYAKLSESMKLFKPFLSPRYKFFWTEVLDKAFIESKKHIIDAIKEGVEIFDTNKPTCLRPDWSKKGIGYFLLQKHCNCNSDLPDCCISGWKITLAGSRFLRGPEERYAAIEGEALAIVWGLEQTKYFTQGCPNLLVVTDHKPLTKIFGDRTLDEISNTRLFRLKQKTLPWSFNIEHMPGKTNCVSDALSRYPTTSTDASDESETDECSIIAGIGRDITDISTISWKDLAMETAKDEALSDVMKYLSNAPDSTPLNNEYTKYTESLYTCEGVVLYMDRVVMPRSLRKAALTNLHAAHQGTSTMELRAKKIMFWPGMSNDIHRTRAACADCNANAPSQAPLPSTPATPPSSPFEKIFGDYFDFAGHHYLVIGDRLSGWPEVYSTPKRSNMSGSKGLIACLRALFATFGVPEEISSDRGPEFTSKDVKDFLERWGVHHRKSSAYFPQSNGRAEVAVKSTKRLLRSNIDASGNLNSDKFLRAMLQLRNTPDPDCNVSPAQIVFGRPLKDAFSFVNRLDKFRNQAINPIWREAWQLKEQALRARFVKSSEVLNRNARSLKKLSIGDRCFVQNQTGPAPNKWDRTGVIVEIDPHDQYIIKIDGSGRLTTRNRRFLRYFQPAVMQIQPAATSLTAKREEHTQAEPDSVQITQPNADRHYSQHDQLSADTDTIDNGGLHEYNSGGAVEATSPKHSLTNRSPVPNALKCLFPNDQWLNQESLHLDGGRKLRNRTIINNKP